MVKFWFKIEGYAEMGTSGDGMMFIVNHHLNNTVAYIQGNAALLKDEGMSVGHTFKVDRVEVIKEREEKEKEESVWRPPIND